MQIAVELAKVIINENSEKQIVVLKEKNGTRVLPIMIGIPEVLAIDRNLKKKKSPRPMTHDLVLNVITAMSGQVERIVITDEHQGIYFAVIVVDCNGESIEIDSRPSDAIAISLACNGPIFVEENVFEQL